MQVSRHDEHKTKRRIKEEACLTNHHDNDAYVMSYGYFTGNASHPPQPLHKHTEGEIQL